MFFACDGAQPADNAQPTPAEPEVATPPPAETEVVTTPEVTTFRNVGLTASPLPTRWWHSFTRGRYDYMGEISLTADTLKFEALAWTLKIRLSDIESVRQDKGSGVVVLQYRTVDGGSDEVWLCHWNLWSLRPTRQLHDAIAARLAPT